MIRWRGQDRRGNEIYTTTERWTHIVFYHPELADLFDEVVDTIRTGRWRQSPLDLNKYSYARRYDRLLPEYSHIIVMVVFKPGNNNFVTTAFPKYIYPKGGN